MNDDCQNSSCWQQVHQVGEVVTNRVISAWEWFFEPHEVDDSSGRTDEEQLHEGVVEADKVEEEVDVADAEHDQVYFLRFAWYT